MVPPFSRNSSVKQDAVSVSIRQLPFIFKQPYAQYTQPQETMDPKIIFRSDALRYNPCGDLIFPSVIRTDSLPAPLGRYYLYYAPHDSPGGICLAYADDPAGPWTEYESNPIISRSWLPHYEVSHVSSPDALLVPGGVRVFFHGDNDTTRSAMSKDGIHFESTAIAVQASQLPDHWTCFYGRAFRLPAGKRDRYALLFAAYGDGEPGIYAAFSPDGENWELAPDIILPVPDIAGASLPCAPFLLPFADRLFLVVHLDFGWYSQAGGPVTDVYAVEVDCDLNLLGTPQLLLRHDEFAPDNTRVSDPCIVIENQDVYIFLSIGPRLQQRLAVVHWSSDQFAARLPGAGGRADSE